MEKRRSEPEVTVTQLSNPELDSILLGDVQVRARKQQRRRQYIFAACLFLVVAIVAIYVGTDGLPRATDPEPASPYLPNIRDPEAVNAQDVCPGYLAQDVQNNTMGFTATLQLAGPPCNVYGTDVEFLNLTVQLQSADRLSIIILPSYLDSTNASQYIIPPFYLKQPILDDDAAQTASTNDLEVTWSNDPSFNFAVLRRSTGDVLFDTSGSKLVFEDQFVEFVTSLPEDYNLAGLGERIHALRLGNNHTFTIYNADAANPIDGNNYGSHPFYLDTRYVEANGTAVMNTGAAESTTTYQSYSHGVYLRNAHGQEVVLGPTSLTWRTIGGAIDLYFFSGPTAAAVTQQYQAGAIGYPAMQQYWTFGYHQCRWGYANWTMMQDVVDNFKSFDVPLETIWSDIDYMKQYRDFENDPNTFDYEQAAEFLSKLHANGQHYVPIVDSAIYYPNPNNASDAYPPYDRGNDSDVYLMNPDGSQYIGAVWPGYTVFPDWHSTNAQSWWTDELSNWYTDIAFDGIWVDMSEVASFCSFSCGSGQVQNNPVQPYIGAYRYIYNYPEDFNITNATEAAVAEAAKADFPARVVHLTAPVEKIIVSPGERNLNFPPYALNNVNGPLVAHAVAPEALHHDGVVEYDIHNLWGYEIINATYNALTSIFPTKRPFIIARSTFAGAGALAGHWGGDNQSKWVMMYFSIPQALSMSLFGIPFFGPDTCGFQGNTDMELCARWMQLSAFFPFYRNHNQLAAIPQEPYIWSSVADASRKAIAIRYSILPYMYTLHHLASTTGSTVMRALAWEFPGDGPSLADADRQFLLGPAILVTPVLTPLAQNVAGVFPGWSSNTRWYDWYTLALANEVGSKDNVTLDSPLGDIRVFVKGGSVLPMQTPGYTTAESRQGEWSLLVALDGAGAAEGQLYLDDGESLVVEDSRDVSFAVSTGADMTSLTVTANDTFVDANKLANVTVAGVSEAPCQVTWNGAVLPAEVGRNWNETTSVWRVSGLQNLTSQGAWMQDWTLKWRNEGC